MKPLFTLVLISILATSACSTAAPANDQGAPTSTSSTLSVDVEDPIPVIVDYSPTVSDVGGFLYLLSNPAVEVVAVSLPATGEAGCDLGAEVTLGILTMMGQEDVPVACSDEIPAGSHDWPEEFQPRHPGLLLGLPYATSTISPRSAPDLMAEVAAEADRPVVIWAVGPLTNVARALADHPEMVERIQRIVIMGGAVDVAGSPMIDPAEWNFYVDAAAAASVVSSGVPITLVPLDATNQVPVPSWYRAALNGATQSPQITYLSRMIRTFPNATSGFYYFWDELAAVAVTGELELDVETVRLRVAVGGSENGRTARDPAGSEVLVVMAVDPGSFYAEFLSRLSGEEVTLGSGATEQEATYLMAVADSLAPLVEALGPLWSESDIEPDAAFDTEAMAAALAKVFDALRLSHDTVSSLEVPPTLSEEHTNFLETAEAILGVRTGVLEEIRSSDGSQTALDAIFARLPDFDTACVPYRDKAQLLGVVAEFPCG